MRLLQEMYDYFYSKDCEIFSPEENLKLLQSGTLVPEGPLPEPKIYQIPLPEKVTYKTIYIEVFKTIQDAALVHYQRDNNLIYEIHLKRARSGVNIFVSDSENLDVVMQHFECIQAWRLTKTCNWYKTTI